jgi:putative flavoprotein involved in K+ transport
VDARRQPQYLALQLKARFEDIPTPVYGLQEARHTS